MSSVSHSYVFGMSLICTRMLSVCHSYVPMYSYVTRMSLVRTRISAVCDSYLLVCHSYVTHLCFYHETSFRHLSRSCILTKVYFESSNPSNHQTSKMECQNSKKEYFGTPEFRFLTILAKISFIGRRLTGFE